MKGTRDQILDLLRRNGEMTVQALSAALALAPAALRRHLDILIGEGSVECRAVRQATGRPYYAFRLTQEARERLSGGTARLMERLILAAAALDVTETEGRVLDALFNRVSDRMIAEHRPEVQGETLAQRVESLTTALREEGILDTWSQQPDGFHLYNACCPHQGAARVSSGVCCAAEQRTISRLLQADVEQVGCIARGQTVCEYIVPAGSGEHPAR